MILFLVIIMALLETLSVASIMPFLAVLGNQDMVYSNDHLAAVYKYVKKFGVSSTDGFFIILGFGSFVLIIVSAAYRTVTHYHEPVC